jgi:hypothetical protein
MAHLVNRERLISHLGLEASNAQLEHLTLQRFGQRHCAHVLANARQPELAAVVLSLVDQRGSPRTATDACGISTTWPWRPIWWWCRPARATWAARSAARGWWN